MSATGPAALELCEQVLAAHLGEAVTVFGSAALGVVDLPALSAPSRLSAQEVALGGAVLWLSFAERAGLPHFLERLAVQWAAGQAPWVLEGGAALVPFRPDRIEVPLRERVALYSRVVGTAGAALQNRAFPAALDGFAETLTQLSRTRGNTQHLEVRAAVLGEQAARALASRTRGLVAFQVRELLANIRVAIAAMERTPLSRDLGGGSAWDMVQRHSLAVLHRQLDPHPLLRRGEAGLHLVRFLSRRLPELSQGRLRLSAADPVLGHAEIWRLPMRPALTLPTLPTLPVQAST